ncbi:MAG: hypothetical protein K2X00_04650 [Nitrospiraceae bacterium]|jgi:hypothetical protein|nr:hypothetical protein [Nitrospiraceae bacterium]OQW64256.1 MAG: hypothetical protein BVN29_13230 [Nitrospira sp. ST-bin5]
MWILILMVLLSAVTPSFAEQNFSEKYERDYNIFNPASQYAPDNPLNPAQAFAPDHPFNPANRFDPGNPVNFVVTQDLEDEEIRWGDFLSVECV